MPLRLFGLALAAAVLCGCAANPAGRKTASSAAPSAAALAVAVAANATAVAGTLAAAVPAYSPIATTTPPVTPVPAGLQDVGPFFFPASGQVQVSNRATLGVVEFAAGDTIHFPSGMVWGAPPNVSMGGPGWIAANTRVAGTKLYVWLQADADEKLFDRVDDATLHVPTAGEAILYVTDDQNADHGVALDARGHLLLDPALPPGAAVINYNTGEQLDVSAATIAGHVRPPRHAYPTEWAWPMCEGEICRLSYRVGPLFAPFSGTVQCQNGDEFDFDAGAFRLQFRDAGTLRNNATWIGPVPVDCGQSRTVRAGDLITDSFVHYIVGAVSSTGEPISVAVADDGTLYVGHVGFTYTCGPCRGS